MSGSINFILCVVFNFMIFSSFSTGRVPENHSYKPEALADTKKKEIHENDDDILAMNTTNATKLRLIYGYDVHANEYKYCEWANMKQLKNGYGSISPECQAKNKNMAMKVNGEVFFPFFRFSHGSNGILAECPELDDFSSYHCTNQRYVYSVCHRYDTLNKDNLTKICKMEGPENNVRTKWSNVSSKAKHIDNDNEDGSESKTNVIIICISVVIIIMIIIIVCLVYNKRDRIFQFIRSLKTVNTSNIAAGGETGKEEQAPSRNGGEERRPLSPMRMASTFEVSVVTDILETKTPTTEDQDGPRLGMAELPQDRHSISNQMIMAGKDLKSDGDEEELLGHLRNSIDQGSLEDIPKHIGLTPRDDIGAVKCTTSVGILLQQSKEYINVFCEYFEVSGQDEENTMKGLAKLIHKDIGLVCPRGVDVSYENPPAYLKDHKPCIGILLLMDEYGVLMRKLIDYFQRKDQIDHLLKVHPNCEYCQEIASRKKYNIS